MSAAMVTGYSNAMPSPMITAPSADTGSASASQNSTKPQSATPQPIVTIIERSGMRRVTGVPNARPTAMPMTKVEAQSTAASAPMAYQDVNAEAIQNRTQNSALTASSTSSQRDQNGPSMGRTRKRLTTGTAGTRAYRQSPHEGDEADHQDGRHQVAQAPADAEGKGGTDDQWGHHGCHAVHGVLLRDECRGTTRVERGDEHRQQLHQDRARGTQDGGPQQRQRPAGSGDQDGTHDDTDHGAADGDLSPDTSHHGSADQSHDDQAEGEQGGQQGNLAPAHAELMLEWREDGADAVEQVGEGAADPEQDPGQAAARGQDLGLRLHPDMVAHQGGVSRRTLGRGTSCNRLDTDSPPGLSSMFAAAGIVSRMDCWADGVGWGRPSHPVQEETQSMDRSRIRTSRWAALLGVAALAATMAPAAVTAQDASGSPAAASAAPVEVNPYDGAVAGSGAGKTVGYISLGDSLPFVKLVSDSIAEQAQIAGLNLVTCDSKVDQAEALACAQQMKVQGAQAVLNFQLYAESSARDLQRL